MARIDLTGRKAVVTGGAQGVGRAVAEALIAAGAYVTLWDRDRGRVEMTADALDCGFIEVDVADWDRVRSAAARSEAEMDRVDILVCAEGEVGPTDPLADAALAALRRVLDVELIGVAQCLKALAPGMAARGGGRIVVVTAPRGAQSPANAAAAAGVAALTRSHSDAAIACVSAADAPAETVAAAVLDACATP